MKAAASDFATALIDENGDVNGSFEKLKDTAFTFFDNLKPRIMAFLEAISPIATTVAGITGAFVAFKSAASISTLLSTLVASWNAYKVANEGATIAQWLMNAAMNANPIVLIVTLIGGLIAALVALWHTNDDFRNALIGAWDAIKNAAVVVWESIVKFFTEDIPNAFNAVINFVKDNWQALLLFITNPIAGALKLLYDLNPKFREWVDNVWQSIKNGFNKIIDGAKTWGKDLLDNFIGGIKAKIQKLKDMVSNVAQTVKDFLGFSEPEKGPLSNFHTYAPDMMDLFAKGIRDNEDVITDQIEKSFDFGERTMKFGAEYGGGYGAVAAGGAFGGTSIGNININIDGAKYTDEQSLASAIALEIQNMTDRRAAVYA
jgi:phage-related protein